MPASVMWWLAAGVACVLVIVAAALIRIWLLLTVAHGFKASFRKSGGDWVRGVVCYTSSGLCWFRLWSLAWWPDRVWLRSALELRGVDAAAVGAKPASPNKGLLSVLLLHHDGRNFELATHADVATGVSSWLEGGPPQSHAFFT